MILSVSSTLSALRAFGAKMGVNANNVANADTEGYKKRRAVLQEGSNNDVQVDIEQVNTPGPAVAEEKDGQITEKEMSNVDLAEELTQTILNQRGLEVNLTTLKTQDEMIGSVIDMFE
jgi:flagellar basal-body rod protein FlgC